MTTIDLTCGKCGSNFQRPVKEFNRNKKEGSLVFCSRKCGWAGRRNTNGFAPSPHLRQYVGLNHRDAYSSFRLHLRCAKRRAQEGCVPCVITLEDLKSTWSTQQGKCPLTGWDLVNPQTSGIREPRSPNRASLDRIDGSKGYVPGNIRFVSMMANFAKNSFSDEQLVQFCLAVATKHNLQNSGQPMDFALAA